MVVATILLRPPGTADAPLLHQMAAERLIGAVVGEMEALTGSTEHLYDISSRWTVLHQVASQFRA